MDRTPPWRFLLRVPGNPAGQARARHGRAKSGKMHHWYDEESASFSFRNDVHLKAKTSWYGDEPFEGPVKFRGLYIFSPNANAPYHEEWHLDVPDTDNITKAIFDALKGIVFRDDRQVVSIEAQKRRAARGISPFVLIEIVPTMAEEVCLSEEALRIQED